jgi:formylglycine-generating enzyme required for sulfatase activity
VDGKFPAGEEKRPVHGISWDGAAAFCEWAQKRLPSEAEWEVAARGAEGRLYPWGDNQRAVELPRSGTYDVGTKLTNQSPFGVLDMAGNIWEWVGEPYAPVEEGHRVLRGGANDFMKDMAYRLQGDPTLPTMVASAGVRCAATEVDVVETEMIADQDVLYQDTFADPGSGWPIQSEEIVFFGYHPPDFYHVQVGTANSYTAVSRPPLFDDVTVEAEVQVDSTDTEAGGYRYGLTLRRTSKDQFYAFTVSPRSSAWAILKSSGSDLEVLAEGQVDTLRGFAPAGFAPDQNDTLRVDAQGSEFVFHINDEVVAQVSDAAYGSGEVGFFVQTFDESRAHIHYDSLVIREAELAEAPAATALYEDDFTNPATGWVQEDEAGKPYRVGYHPPDYYHVEVRVPEDHIVVTEPQSFDDATVETELFVDSTDTENGDFRYGLALRRTDDQYYAFTVSSRSGSWSILKSSPAGLEVLAEGTASTLRGFAPVGFSPDKSDILRVDAAGPEFIFHINNEPVARISDQDYSSGEVGFFVETLDEGRAHIHYNSLTVHPVDESALTSFEPVPAAEATPPSPPEGGDAASPPEEEDEPATPEPTPEASPTATPVSSTEDQVEEVEGMVLVPAGRFLMGSASGEANEQPEHEVSLDAFLIDQFEVSNAQYRACVEAGSCTASRLADAYTYRNYRDDPAYDNYPVINVSWDQAVAYCTWAEKRLPTEAEWEYAASGPDDFDWPWGNSFDSQLSAASASDTQPVDSYTEGASPFDVYNMAGNVTEWVEDVFDEGFYASSEGSHNPVNTGEAGSRILRGGSFDNTEASLYRTSRRLVKSPTFYDVDTGFRCAKDAQ